jgi:hypothetical protein
MPYLASNRGFVQGPKLRYNCCAIKTSYIFIQFLQFFTILLQFFIIFTIIKFYNLYNFYTIVNVTIVVQLKLVIFFHSFHEQSLPLPHY